MKWGVIIASAFLFNMTAYADHSKSFTLSDALGYAYDDNPTLNAARYELRRINEQLPQARAGWRPTIKADLSAAHVDVTGDPQGPDSDGASPKSISLSLQQPIYQGGSTFAATRGAKSIIQAQNYTLLETQQTVLSTAAEAYMNVLRDQGLLLLSQKNKNVIQEQLRATRDRFDEGSVTKTDVKQAEARLAGAKADVIQLEGQLDSSRAFFKQIIGREPVNLDTTTVMPILPSTLEDNLSMAKKNAPAILTAQALKEAQEADVDRVAGELLPQVFFNASYTDTDDPLPGLVDDSSETFVELVVSIPLYQAGSVRSRVREAQQEAFQRRVQIIEVKRQIEQQVIASWRTFQSAKAEILARRTQVEAATIASEGVNIEATEGSRTILDILDADQELLDAQVDELIAIRNEVVAAFNLAAVLGLLTPESLGFVSEL